MKSGLQAYIKGTIEAVEFYHRAFNTELGYNVRNDDNTFLHAELVVDGVTLLAISEQDSKDFGNTMQFCVTFDGDKDAVTKAYNVLKEDYKAIYTELDTFFWGSYGADLVDKFGVRWYIADK